MDHSPEDDSELEAAIALSLAEEDDTATLSDMTSQIADGRSTSRVPVVTQSHTSGLAGLDRKAMERERLARLATRERSPLKRNRSISPPPTRVTRKAPKLEETTVDLPSGAKLKMFSATVAQDQSTRKPEGANAANARLRAQRKDAMPKADADVRKVPETGLQYPNGVVRKTWAFGHERAGNDIKIEEVLEASSLRTAVLSAFQWDTNWVLSKLKVPPNGGTTKCIFVMQAKHEDLRHQMLRETEGMRPFLRLCFPSMEGQINCMHSKLMLLFHAHKLRIAIPTANLLNFDWGETGQMENSAFIIDLPRLPADAIKKVDDLTFFGQELQYFLAKQGIDDDVRTGVLKFDFGATANMAFVHTAGGSFHRQEAGRTGFPGLGRAVRYLGLQAEELEIDFAASSIGSLNNEYLKNVHGAAKGDDVVAQLTGPAPKADFFKPTPKMEHRAAFNIRDNMRIYFPTHETVVSSTAGATGTICIARQYWENMPFPRRCFRDYRSTRAGLLSHNKIMYARGKRHDTTTGKTQDLAWVYVGSANMSESAWGKLLYDKKEKAAKINCRNWECGVLLSVPAQKLKREVKTRTARTTVEGEDSETESEDEQEAANGASLVGMDVFNGLVDVPFEFPGRMFDGREPWYFKEQPR